MRPARLMVNAFLAVSLAALACGGGNDGTPSPSPGPNPGPPPPQNPCTTAAALEEDAPAEGVSARVASKQSPLGNDGGRWNVLDSLWKHRAAVDRGALAGNVQGAVAEDVGEIGVLQDQGDLIVRPNAFDLKGLGLRFVRNGSGGYDVTRTDAAFRTTLGNRLTLGDDDSLSASLPFTFSFYGKSQERAFVNSDGNITFEDEDRASSARDVSRLLTGPPRVAGFLADLDPTTTGGRVFLQAASDQFTVTWCGVHGFDSTQTATVQTTLLPDGSVEVRYADSTTLTDAVVGVSPGRTGDFRAIDLSASGGSTVASDAVGERFASASELDLVSVARRFYQSHPDTYDQLVIWTDTRLAGRGTFAFEVTVANEVRGLGVDIYDTARDFGSAGRLRSVVMMDTLTKYPDDPTQKFLGEDNTLSLVGQEVGHRWLAFMRFRDHTGRTSEALLGRDQTHWSFFFDSDASVMEGNDIEDLGGGSFRTIAAVERYSLLDQYAMGLVRESDVPRFFYVESPLNVVPAREAASDPQVGVTFMGTRRDVLIQDVVAVLGTRQPAFAAAPKVHRQAFLYIVSGGRAIEPGEVAKLDRIRREWASFFSSATSNRGRVETRLRPPS